MYNHVGSGISFDFLFLSLPTGERTWDVANKKEGKYTVGRFIFATVNICDFYRARKNNGAMQKGAFNVHEPAATAAVIPVGRKSVTSFQCSFIP